MIARAPAVLLAVLVAMSGSVPTAALAGPLPGPGIPAGGSSQRAGALLVRYRAGTRVTPGMAAPASHGAGVPLAVSRVLGDGTVRLDLPAGTGPDGVAAITARLAADPAVLWVEPDQWFTAIGDPVVPATVPAAPDDPYYSSQAWHYDGTWGIRMRQAWEATRGSPDVIVAVVDTGITTHPDLNTAVLGTGADLIADVATANDGDGRDMNAADPGDWVTSAENTYGAFQGCGASNSSWHGTHVAGTIAAASGNGTGVAGVAPGVRILPVRVLGKCGGWMSDVADGVLWAAGLAVPGVTMNPSPAQVISLSLGGGGSCSATMQSAVTAAVAAGSTVVVAAGNSNTLASNATPASCTGVITVSATTQAGVRASYSNYGAAVTLAAPGGDGSAAVWSTLNAGTTAPASPSYAGYMGTSMATPHVSAVLALMISVHPGLTPAEARTILTSTVTAFPASAVAPSCSAGQCGAGIVNARAAIAAALVTKLSQGLTFTPVAPPVIGTSVTLAATTTSGATPTFALDPTSACTLSGATLGYVANGSCTVRASVAATDIWAADEAVRVVAPMLADAITLQVGSTDAVYGDAPVVASATAESGLPVTIVVSPDATCSFADGMVTLLAGGTCEVTATTAGDATHAPGTAATSITIAKAQQVLTPAYPASLLAGVDAELDVTGARTMVTYTSLTPLACTVTGATVTGVGAGTCTIQVSAATDARYVEASAEAGVTVSLRTGAPGGVRVNAGASATRSTSVTLALTWPAWATSAQVASNAGFSSATTITARSSLAWTLAGLDGSKTIYVRFRAATYVDQVAADSILLDRKAPVVGTPSAKVVARAPGKRTVQVTISVSGTGSGVRAYQVTSNRASPGSWRTWAKPFRVTTGASVLYVRIRDAAGLVSAWRTFYPPR